METNKDPRYPIGEYKSPENISDVEVDEHLRVLKNFPSEVKELVEDWNDEQLDTQYREEGWSARQLINHLADSHMHSYLRFKLALTEDNPTIKTYNEATWAELQDSFAIEIKPALQILKGLHKRWVYEIKSLTNKELERTFFHPEQNRSISLRESLAYYAWHCEHHLAQLRTLAQKEGWSKKENKQQKEK